MKEHAAHILLSVVSVTGIELITAVEVELYTKIICQCIICAATVYSVLKSNRKK